MLRYSDVCCCIKQKISFLVKLPLTLGEICSPAVLLIVGINCYITTAIVVRKQKEQMLCVPHFFCIFSEKVVGC